MARMTASRPTIKQGARQMPIGQLVNLNLKPKGLGVVDRPATSMLLIADPDAALSLTGSNVNSMHEQQELLVDCNYGAGTKWTRETAVLDGFNVMRHAGAYVEYRFPNIADGKLNKWISSPGGNAPEGCLVLVFKPTSVETVYGEWFTTQFALACVQAGMINDGTDKFKFAIRDTGGTLLSVAVACSLNNWHYAIMRWTTTHIYLSIDGGVETAAAMGTEGGVSNMASRLQVLSDGATGERARGDFMELSIIDPADRVQMAAFLEQNYPTLAV